MKRAASSPLAGSMQTRGKVKISYVSLAHAAKEGALDVVMALIKEGADPTVADDEGVTALLIAAFNGHAEICHALIAAGAKVDARTTEPMTPLLWAAARGHEASARVLLYSGADAGAHDAYYWTPLQRAHEAGFQAVVQTLREYGATESAVPDGQLGNTDGGGGAGAGAGACRSASASASAATPSFATAIPFNGSGGLFGAITAGLLPAIEPPPPTGSLAGGFTDSIGHLRNTIPIFEPAHPGEPVVKSGLLMGVPARALPQLIAAAGLETFARISAIVAAGGGGGGGPPPPPRGGEPESAYCGLCVWVCR